MHCLDIGVVQDWIGNVLWEYMQYVPGTNVTERDPGRETDTPCHISGFSVEQKALVPAKIDEKK